MTHDSLAFASVATSKPAEKIQRHSASKVNSSAKPADEKDRSFNDVMNAASPDRKTTTAVKERRHENEDTSADVPSNEAAEEAEGVVLEVSDETTDIVAETLPVQAAESTMVGAFFAGHGVIVAHPDESTSAPVETIAENAEEASAAPLLGQQPLKSATPMITAITPTNQPIAGHIIQSDATEPSIALNQSPATQTSEQAVLNTDLLQTKDMTQNTAATEKVAAPIIPGQLQQAQNIRLKLDTTASQEKEAAKQDATNGTTTTTPITTAPQTAPPTISPSQIFASPAFQAMISNNAAEKSDSNLQQSISTMDADDIAMQAAHHTTQLKAQAMPSFSEAHRMLGQQTAQQITAAITPIKPGTTDIALSPMELGKVKITISGSENNMMVVINAERPETADLMRRNIDMLQNELKLSSNADITFSFANSESQDKNNDQNSSSGSSAAQGVTTNEQEAAILQAGPSRHILSSNLDLRL